MLGLFIPSHNRACQLYALIESIKLYDNCELYKNIHIRWSATSELQKLAYKKLLESDIVEGIDIQPKCGLSLSRDMYPIMENNKYTYFSITTDDSLFYRLFCITLDDLDDFMSADVNHLSFRIGFNTNIVDYSNPEQKEYLKDWKRIGKLIKFQWIYNTGHLGYPCAIDSSIWNREYILNMTQQACGLNFDFRYFECRLHEHLKIFSKKHYGLCLPESALVNIPVNMVSDGPYCKNGVQYSYTIDILAQKFLDGYKIDITEIGKHDINSVQMELPFRFIKYE